MYSRILVPVDLDHADKLGKALDLAGKTAQESDASVFYVSVVDAVPTASSRTEGDKAKELLDSFAADQAHRYGIKVSDHVALRGDLHLKIGQDIIETAKQIDCDLIVMASHVPGLKEHVIASNAGYVASHAPMSVFVVR